MIEAKILILESLRNIVRRVIELISVGVNKLN
ncbi:MAG: hypothetical protein UX26_C0002G0041 [Parcubacteria group bacterium GW2011_GWC1_45_9]|nr:MAG: hypothetical protein UX26_C0002G0041 [Parcubacteria group bacterium GW2011_GWC1_45_9]